MRVTPFAAQAKPAPRYGGLVPPFCDVHILSITNNMNYKQITNNVRVRDLFKIFLLIGFVIASTRIENFHYQREDYNDRPIQVNTELVISEQSNKENILWWQDVKHDISAASNEVILSFYSYTYVIKLYNGLILTAYKTIISNTKYYSEIISIIQKTNIWHKSSKKEPFLS
jgi:hypothetical protein